MKTCNICKQNKLIINFTKDCRSADGFAYKCRDCQKNWARQHYQKNKKEIIKKQTEYYYNNIEVRKKAANNHYKKNKKIILKRRKFYNKNTSENKRISAILRSRISKIVKYNQKGGSAVKDLGCTVDFFIKYLESKFEPGMTWENRGFYGWHIDHIIPLSSFDLSIREQFLQACHYTNLQPLWSKDNLSKSKGKI